MLRSSSQAKNKAEKEAAAARGCPFQGCRGVLVAGTSCQACGQSFCVRHRHRDDHHCTAAPEPVAGRGSSTEEKPRGALEGVAEALQEGSQKLTSLLPASAPPALEWKNSPETPIATQKPGEAAIVLGVHFPPSSPLQPRWMSFNPRWSLGRLLDAITSKAGLVHRTNEPVAKRWQLFSVATGAV